jgi:thioester reductase-like protein
MLEPKGILLTGGTGLLGQYLLHQLLSRRQSVAVLVRDSRQQEATERVAEIVSAWSKRLGQKLSLPIVVNGDLGQPGCGVAASDRSWLGRNCQIVIHSAANVAFRGTANGEPWRTNVEGTKTLLALCRDVGMSELHHVSTAFVCGKRAGIIAEDDFDNKHGFHNPYEESKHQAEHIVRTTPGIRVTIYRPSVIVGDSRTGFTSTFNGLYRFLELAARLVPVAGGKMRLPLTGDEEWDLVCVDWVSQAIVKLMDKPRWHGRTFHLVAHSPVFTRVIRDIGARILNLPGVDFEGGGAVEQRGRLEQLFFDGIQEYWTYLGGNPRFASDNTREALPDLPPCAVDGPVLERLIRFALANRWGRSTLTNAEVAKGTAGRSTCAESQTGP